MIEKILLLAQHAYVIRSTKANGHVLYMQSTTQWTAQPSHATIFRDPEAGEAEAWRLRHQTTVIAKGELLDVCTLAGALQRQNEMRR